LLPLPELAETIQPCIPLAGSLQWREGTVGLGGHSGVTADA